jgi:glycerophosphoryl diester phosphodiesterase
MKDMRWLLTIPVAHRGYHSPGIPENSIAAFHEALKNGLNIEMDVHMTKDDVLVVFHDDNLFRLTSYDKIIEDCTGDEIKNLVLDKTNERIPAFSEVLDHVHGRAGLFIEVKTHPDIGRVEALLAHCLDAYTGKFAVLSFDPRVLQWFYRNRPHYIRGQISGGLKVKKLPLLQRFLLKNLFVNLLSRPDFVAYEYQYLNAWIRLFTKISRVPVIAWTIRDPAAAKKLRETGQNFIFEGFDCKNLREKRDFTCT